MKRSALLGLLLAGAVPAGAIQQEKIADPRPKSAVVDLTRTLAPADVAAIDTMADRARGGGELMVVVIDSTSGAAPRDYTTRLFNRWGLDGAARNRGVMLLVAIKDRKAEIVIGDGFPDAVVAVTDRIMRDEVVARFKAGRPREAVVGGSRAIVDDVILSTDAALTSAPTQPAAASLDRTPPAAPVPGTFFERAMNGAVDNPLPTTGAAMGLAAAGGLLRRYLRNRPRRCKACGTMMTRLNETADNAHLQSGEKVEEMLGSVDYDVWACPCGQTLKLRYGAFLTSYSKCKGCQAKTLEAKTTTLVSATTSSEGRARVHERCEHCSYTNTYERTIPRIRQASSSSGSSRSSGSSSGRGSSGSW